MLNDQIKTVHMSYMSATLTYNTNMRNKSVLKSQLMLQ